VRAEPLHILVFIIELTLSSPKMRFTFILAFCSFDGGNALKNILEKAYSVTNSLFFY
jgi:hypothetical protein